MTGMLKRGLQAGLAIAATLGSAWVMTGRSGAPKQSPLPSALSLEPCQVPTVEGAARCGTFEVFENRESKAGRRIKLHLIVLPAVVRKPAEEAVFILHGGPGAAATELAEAADRGFLQELRERHDLVFVDQRGTGQSNGLNCDVGDDPKNLPEFFGELFPPDKIRACRQKLETMADLRMYTTPIAMDDLDDVRQALGYNQIDLLGVSYGTVAAQVYMRQHPEHVRAAVLVGVATTAIKQPLLFARGAQHALDLLFQDCAADQACHSAYPNLSDEFRRVLARFEPGAIEVEMLNPDSREKQKVRLARGNFVERLRLLLYTTLTARFVPMIIHHAYQNDYLPFEAAALQDNTGAIIARGMYLTVTCSEGVPFISDEELARETKGTFVGDYRVRVHQEACKLWPRGAVPASFIEPVKSPAPVLMISGELDGSTPPWWGESAIKYLPNGRQVKIRNYGHQLNSPCVWKIMDDFVEKGSADGLDTSCTEAIRRPPFVVKQ